jgi:hypothetical protein
MIYPQISRQLDALSHFHFTPRPIVADTKLKSLQPSASAVASLMLEDITPVTVLGGNASQSAPEQVLEKKRGKEGSLMADVELTSEDKKRKRRASKAANKAKKQRTADDAMFTAGSATTASPAQAAAKAREENRALRVGRRNRLLPLLERLQALVRPPPRTRNRRVSSRNCSRRRATRSSRRSPRRVAPSRRWPTLSSLARAL